MIILETTDTLKAAASGATSIYATGSLLEINTSTGAETFKGFGPTAVGTLGTTLYTAPANTTAIVKSLLFVNINAAARNVNVYKNGLLDANRIYGGSAGPGTAMGAGYALTYGDGGWRMFDASGVMQVTAGGGGVADADYGDITVSGSGTAWAIDANAVTYAKMQDISATSRILGRITAGAGDTEELTAANVKTILALAQADISGLTTASSPQFTALEIGAASDTTLARSGAGELTVEGNRLFRVGGADVPIADGGTGQSTAGAAFTALAVAQIILGGKNTPAAWAGNKDNYAPASLATTSNHFWDLGGAGRTITGIDATGLTEGQIFMVNAINAGGGTLTYSHASASSTSGNRFGCPNGVNYVTPVGMQTLIVYNPTASAANPFRIFGTVI